MDGNTAAIMCERESTDAAGAFPITPSTQMGEYWADAAAKGHLNISDRPLIFIEPEGEHAAAAVTAGLSMTGLRAANFSSGQGIAYMHESLYAAVGKRLTYVLNIGARAMPVVDPAKCTACGDCVEVCPKDLFSLQPESHRLWVACKNLEHGEAVLEDCQVGCTACGKCVMDAPGDLINMKNNLPVIDYSRNHSTRAPIQRCPTGAIVWLDDTGAAVKGKESVRILRKGSRSMGNT